MTIKTIGDELDVPLARQVLDRASITASWDTLAEALDAGLFSERQFAKLLDSEPPDDAPPLVVNLWARALRRAAADPKGYGVDLDAMRTHACRCGPGTKGRATNGWVFEVGTSHVSGLEVTYAAPCPNCNRRQLELWVDCWQQGGEHRCPKCAPHNGKTPTPLAGDRGVSDDERAKEREEAALREAAMVQDTLR